MIPNFEIQEAICARWKEYTCDKASCGFDIQKEHGKSVFLGAQIRKTNVTCTQEK